MQYSSRVFLLSNFYIGNDVIKNILWFYLCPRVSLFHFAHVIKDIMKNLLYELVKIEEIDLFLGFFESDNCGIPYSGFKIDTRRPDKLCWKRNSRILSYSGLIRGNDRSKTDQRGIMYGNSASISCPPAHSPNARLDLFRHLVVTFDRLTFS